jgi:hypothetical protein
MVMVTMFDMMTIKNFIHGGKKNYWRVDDDDGDDGDDKIFHDGVTFWIVLPCLQAVESSTTLVTMIDNFLDNMIDKLFDNIGITFF